MPSLTKETFRFKIDPDQVFDLKDMLKKHDDRVGIGTMFGVTDFPPYGNVTLVLLGSKEENKEIVDTIKFTFNTDFD